MDWHRKSRSSCPLMGKCGTSGAMKEILKDQCTRNNPVLELQIRSLEKLAKGYDIIPAQTQLP